MRGLLSVMVVIWIAVFANLPALSGPVYQPHPGTGAVLVPAGDDPGGH